MKRSLHSYGTRFCGFTLGLLLLAGTGCSGPAKGSESLPKDSSISSKDATPEVSGDADVAASTPVHVESSAPQASAEPAVGLGTGALVGPSPASSEPVIAPRPQAREIAKPERPAWADEILFEMNFSGRGEQRRVTSARNEYEIFDINRRGVITGEDFLSTAKPWSRSFWEMVSGQAGKPAEESDRLYREYLRSASEFALGKLELSRILDNESMKRKYEPGALPARVDYVVRSVLLRNAADTGSLETVEIVEHDYLGRETGRHRELKNAAAVNQMENGEFYAALKERVAGRPVKFNIDWKYDEFGMGQELAIAVPSFMVPLSWPSVAISFAKLPETCAAFEAEVKRQLDAVAQRVRRQMVWQQLMAERQAGMQYDLLFAMRSDQVQKLYDSLKDRMFSVEESDASGVVVSFGGSRAKEASDRLEAILAGLEAEAVQSLFPAGTPAPRNAEEQKALRDRVNAARVELTQRALAQIATEFGGAVSQGADVLSIVTAPVKAHSDGSNEQPADPSSRDAIIRELILNRAFAGASLLPRRDVTASAAASGKIEFVLLTGFEPGAVHALPVTDERVQSVIRQGLQMKVQGRHFRELAFKLLRENGLQPLTSVCSDSAWPCPRLDAVTLVETMFPETLYPGDSLGFDGPGRPKTSSLLESQLLDHVMSISIDGFAQVFDTPNHAH